MATEMLKSDRTLVAKMMISMMDKDVPGFCTDQDEACQILGVSIDDLMSETDVQRQVEGYCEVNCNLMNCFKGMIVISKLDRVLLSRRSYNGKMLK